MAVGVLTFISAESVLQEIAGLLFGFIAVGLLVPIYFDPHIGDVRTLANYLERRPRRQGGK